MIEKESMRFTMVLYIDKLEELRRITVQLFTLIIKKYKSVKN